MINKFKESNKTKKILRILTFLTQSVLFIILTLTALTFVTSKTSVLGSVRSMVVLSGSMEPSLPVGSIVYIRKPLSYAVNDIITYQTKDDMNVTHRITGFDFTEEGTVYNTKGDANKTADSKVILGNQILGKVFLTIPHLGRIISFLNSPKGFFALIVGPSLIFIGIELWNIKKEIEKEVEKRILARIENFKT